MSFNGLKFSKELFMKLKVFCYGCKVFEDYCDSMCMNASCCELSCYGAY